MQGNGRIPLIDAKRPVNVLLIRSLKELIDDVCMQRSVLESIEVCMLQGLIIAFVVMPGIRGSEKQRTQNN